MTLTANSRRKIVIIGGSPGGMRVMSQIFRDMRWPDVTLIEPAVTHSYEHLWPLVAAGVLAPEKAVKPLRDLMPESASWVRQEVKKVDTKKKVVEVESGRKIPYEYLVVANDLDLAFDDIKGLDGHLGRQGLCSVHTFEQACQTWKQVEEVSEGPVLFALNQMKKGADLAQRLMLLVDDHLRSKGKRKASPMTLALVGDEVHEMEKLRGVLTSLLQKHEIEVKLNHKLVSVDAEARLATFDILNEKGKSSGETWETPYRLLHITPDMTPPKMLAKSKIAGRTGASKGWLSVDPTTLQHKKQKTIFGVGATLAIDTPRTDAAAQRQAAVVAHNMLSTLKGRGPGTFHKYDGYSAYQLSPEFGSVLTVETNYEEKEFGAGESSLQWLLQRYMGPARYWRQVKSSS